MKLFKRYLIVIMIIIFILLLIFISMKLMSKGYTNTYNIDKFNITEIYTKSEKDEHNNHYVEININDLYFNYQFYKKISDTNKLVKDIYYYDGEYKCILPILSDNIKVDFMCYKDGEYYNYVNIIGNESKLDRYISKIDKEKYNVDNFKDSKKNSKEYEKIKFYVDNLPKDIMLTMTTLKGLITAYDDKVISNEFFDKDVYEKNLSIFRNNYYITANYKGNQDFSEIYIINILNNKKSIIKTPDYISYDSYIQGVVDDEVYLYDINNEKQYKINISDEKISVIGNANKGIKYYDGSWDTISTIKANNKILFKNKNFKEVSHHYIYKYGNKLSGFYYYFFESKEGYSVYRVNVQDKYIMKYLFDIKNINDVKFIEDYALFKDNNSIKIYSDYSGIKTVIEYSELEYNDNIKFNVFR